MRYWIQGAILFAGGLLAAGIIAMVAAPPRGPAVVLLPAPTPAPIRVHVSGAVVEPGVLALPFESRVEDAIKAAGGVLPEAELRGINLAARLEDGDQISVGLPAGQAGAAPPGQAEPAAASPPAGPSGGSIDLNAASSTELETLSGIGPATAEKIIAYRQENGPFERIEDIVKVSGIGPATFEKIKEHIYVTP